MAPRPRTRPGPRRARAAAGAVLAAAALAPAASAAPSDEDRSLVLATPDGARIATTVAHGTTGGEAAARSYVAQLGRLPHGPELDRLRLVVVPRAAVGTTCGGPEGDAVRGCYEGDTATMILPDDGTAPAGGAGGGVPISFVLAHEYGHHVAATRSNAPSDALLHGPKRWASAVHECDAVRRGAVRPRRDGGTYAKDPGEAWAETYARLTFPDRPWTLDPALEPDAAALAAARADVVDPWTASTTRTIRGRIPAGRRSVRVAVPVALDGRASVALSGAPRGAGYDLDVRVGARRLARTDAPGARDRTGRRTVCRAPGVTTMTVRVLRRSGPSGAFRLRVVVPG